MGKIDGEKIKQITRDNYEISPNVYRVCYNKDSECFELSYGIYNDEKEEIQVHSKVSINSDFFIQYFISILDSFEEYNDAEDEDILSEILNKLKEDDEEGGDINE